MSDQYSEADVERVAKEICSEHGCASWMFVYFRVRARNRLRGSPLHSVDRRVATELWKQTDGCCWYCGVRCYGAMVGGGYGYAIDHAFPKSRGGTSHASNLRPACKRCNSRKNDKSVEEFREYLAREIVGLPTLSDEQLRRLAEHGAQLPPLPHIEFHGERLARERVAA
jgi:5-methylcytosine-specific restriction endonuclease McrA